MMSTTPTAPITPSPDPGRAIVVVGSLNMDLVMRTPRLPAAGETLTGRGLATLPGGKGANQAVACARMGAPVSMVGMVGDDAYGQALRQGLVDDGIDVGALRTAAAVHSGVALILVDDAGQNSIVLAPGANARLGPAEVNAEAARITAAAMLIVQLEVPLDAVEAAITIAHRAGVMVLLNPAPAVPLPAKLWPMVDLLVLNESEAGALSGVPVSDPQSAWGAARALRALGAGRVLVTLGAQGVASVDHDGERHAAARPVRAVDTTAAGDTFIGALAAALRVGLPLQRAVELAQAASALCVTRPGAQPSIPYRHEIDKINDSADSADRIRK